MEQVRIDKWLWAARFYKTRGLATEAVLGGHVQVNGARVKPAKDVRAGDVIGLRIGTVAWTVTVRDVAEKRGPAKVAQALYEESAESRAALGRAARSRRCARPCSCADAGPRSGFQRGAHRDRCTARPRATCRGHG